MSKRNMVKLGLLTSALLIAFMLVRTIICPRAAIIEAAAQRSEFPPAETCKACHKREYDEWKSSFHALSSSGPTFKGMFRISMYNRNWDNPAICLDCHAPEVKVKANYRELTEAIRFNKEYRSEGVTCAICHSIESVALNYSVYPEIKLDVAPTPPYHKVRKTDLFKSAMLCAACHDYNTEGGAVCCNPTRDWEKTSLARRGINCQSCHMETERRVMQISTRQRLANKLYDLTGLLRYRDDRGQASHKFQGAHSEEMLKKGVDMQIRAERAGDRIKAVVAIENLTGHSIPNG